MSFLDSMVEVEAMKGQILVKMLKALLTAIILAVLIVIFFLPVVLYVAAQLFPHATTWDIWRNLAAAGAGKDVFLSQCFYLCGLCFLWGLWCLGKVVVGEIWGWLS